MLNDIWICWLCVRYINIYIYTHITYIVGYGCAYDIDFITNACVCLYVCVYTLCLRCLYVCVYTLCLYVVFVCLCLYVVFICLCLWL